jgi:hypothetical protein
MAANPSARQFGFTVGVVHRTFIEHLTMFSTVLSFSAAHQLFSFAGSMPPGVH